jgi:hypothetical protein
MTAPLFTNETLRVATCQVLRDFDATQHMAHVMTWYDGQYYLLLARERTPEAARTMDARA